MINLFRELNVFVWMQLSRPKDFSISILLLSPGRYRVKGPEALRLMIRWLWRWRIDQ